LKNFFDNQKDGVILYNIDDSVDRSNTYREDYTSIKFQIVNDAVLKILGVNEFKESEFY
jgi:hypothetical protein